ncbi:MAG: hypothetical protein QOF74_5712 [Caballeronia mineralivorans]|nr:hypothetical protein [Caballeronia mineralivorans]
MVLPRHTERLFLESIQLEKMMIAPAGFARAMSPRLTPFAARV